MCVFQKTPKTPLINTAKPVKCRIHSAGVEADIIVHSRRLVRNVHCDWLKIAVRFLNATNQISRFWHSLKREIWRCDPRDLNVRAKDRGYPTMHVRMSYSKYIVIGTTSGLVSFTLLKLCNYYYNSLISYTLKKYQFTHNKCKYKNRLMSLSDNNLRRKLWKFETVCCT